LGTHQIWYSK